MTDVNLYFYIEDLGLTVNQRNTLIDELKLLGQRNQSLQPKDRNHWRIRSDGKAVIFEAWWNDTHLTATAIRSRLATIFGVANTSITYATTNSSYGPYIDYTYQTVKRLRFGIFGGLASKYLESHALALSYLAANSSVWNLQV